VATGHALGCLWTITGNVDIPGANVAINTGYVQADIRSAIAGKMPKEIREGLLAMTNLPSENTPLAVMDCPMLY
jgi:anaerobic selenocysteine-containing dehydrogenase